MSTVATETSHINLAANPSLVDAVQSSVNNAMVMCCSTCRCVGVSTVPARDTGLITGLIGVHGKVSGFVTTNMAERFALRVVGGLLQDEYTELTSQVVDGAGEITNIIVGGVKSFLANSEWGFSQITVPSVIVGQGYNIAYARGLEFINVTFELDDPEAVLLGDRLLHVSMSLLPI